MNLPAGSRRWLAASSLIAMTAAVSGCGGGAEKNVVAAESAVDDQTNSQLAVLSSSPEEATKRLQCENDYAAIMDGEPLSSSGLKEEEKAALAKQTPESVAARFAEKHPKSLSHGKTKSPPDPSKTRVAYDKADKNAAKRASVDLRSEAGEITGIVLVVRDDLGNWRFNGSVACASTPTPREKLTPPPPEKLDPPGRPLSPPASEAPTP